MKSVCKKKFDFLLKIDGQIIDTFNSTFRVAFNRMHLESKKRGKDVELFYKPNHHFEKLSDTRFYKRKDENEGCTACNS